MIIPCTRVDGWDYISLHLTQTSQQVQISLLLFFIFYFSNLESAQTKRGRRWKPLQKKIKIKSFIKTGQCTKKNNTSAARNARKKTTMHFSKRASAPAMPIDPPKWSRLKKKKTFRVSPAPFPTLSMGFFKQTDTIIVSHLKAVRKRSPSQGYGAAVNINRCGNVASARSARDSPIP